MVGIISGVVFSTTAFSEPEESPIPPRSAKITVEHSESGAFVLLEGKIGSDDFAAFKEQTAALAGDKRAVVTLESPGGLLMADLRIGDLIHANGWSTYVLDECDSACASIWLAGAWRMMSPIARIGFHTAGFNGQERGQGGAI